MKVVSLNPKHASATVTVCNKEIKFNKGLVAEVEEELGKVICEIFPKTFFPEGEVPKPEKKENESEEVSKLREKVDSLNKENNQLKEMIEKFKVEAEKMDKLIQEGGQSGEKPVIIEEDINIIMELSSKKKEELEETCSGFEFPEEEWKEKNKKELVVYIASKTLNA